MTRTRARLGTPALGLLLIVGALLINFGFYFNWFQNLFASGGRTVHVVFRDAGQLYQGDAVRVDGQVEGKVTGVDLLPTGNGSAVTLQVSDSAPPLYADASASLRWRTLLGGAFYVALDPGTPRSGPLGDRTIRRTSTQVELDDITGIIHGRARQGLQTLPHELARTFADPSVPAGTLSALAGASPALAGGLGALRGVQPGTDLQRVIDRAAVVTHSLDVSDPDLRGLVAGAAATVQVTGARDREIESMLAQGPLVTRQMQNTLAGVDTTLTGVDGLVGRLNGSADEVGPTLAALHPTLVTASGLLNRARPLVSALRPAVTSLVRTSYVGVPLLNALQPSFSRLAGVILPYLGRKDPGTGYSTTVMIGGTAAGFEGAASELDQNGHFIRFPATIGTKSVHLPCASSITDPNVPSALACEDLQTALSSYLSYFPASGLTSSSPSLSAGHRR
jgi:phospholipid/cholesterol/gamma-HCH transport system substrate-binding protein